MSISSPTSNGLMAIVKTDWAKCVLGRQMHLSYMKGSRHGGAWN